MRRQIDQYWSERISAKQRCIPAKYLHVDDYYPGKKHPSIQSINGVRDVPRVYVKAKVFTGTYILQVNRVAFNQNEISPTCLLCGEEDETIKHFILQFSALSDIRQSLLQEMRDIYLNLFHKQPAVGCLLQFILDGDAILKDITRNQKQCRMDIEKISRCLCQRLHAERYKRLSLVPKRKKEGQ